MSALRITISIICWTARTQNKNANNLPVQMFVHTPPANADDPSPSRWRWLSLPPKPGDVALICATKNLDGSSIGIGKDKKVEEERYQPTQYANSRGTTANTRHSRAPLY